MVRGGGGLIRFEIESDMSGTFMINNPALLCTDCWDAIFSVMYSCGLRCFG